MRTTLGLSRRRRRTVLPLVLVALTLAGGAAALEAAGPAAITTAAFDPPIAADINPDPDIVEVNLTAAQTTWQFVSGIDTVVYAYNGSIPGPTIEAELGDTVIVHFTNNLPEPTTIHWHGVDTPASMDGSHISQLWVQPGETFDYQFVVNRASLFWYHPHVRTFDQVEKGLYGGLLVRDPAQDALLGFTNLEEHIVFFDDVLLDGALQIVPAFSFTDPLMNANYQLNGREGNYLLVNGREASEVSLTVANGQPQRWRFVNAANTSFSRLGFEETGADLYMIGTDSGLLEQSRMRRDIVPFTAAEHGSGPQPLHPTILLLAKSLEGVFLLPGERMDVIFTPIGANGDTFTIWNHDWLRGRHIAQYDPMGNIVLANDPLDGMYPSQPFMELALSGPDPGTGPFVPPTDLQTSIPIPPGSKGELPVTFGHSLPDPQGNITLFAQADFSTGTMVPLPEKLVDSFNAHDVEVGDVWTWEVTNLTHGDHPFHTHGFPFTVYEYEFIDMDDPSQNIVFEWPYRELKDTVRAPARSGAKGRSLSITRAVTHFEDSSRPGQAVAEGHRPTFDLHGNYTSGGWLFHCHILEHAARGMLSFYEVHDPNSRVTLLGKHMAGTLGNPSLTAQGDPQGNMFLIVTDAPVHKPVILVASFAAAREPFHGGELVPGREGRKWRGWTNSKGNLVINVFPLPQDKTIYFQAAIEEPAAPNGWALTNALSLDTSQ